MNIAIPSHTAPQVATWALAPGGAGSRATGPGWLLGAAPAWLAPACNLLSVARLLSEKTLRAHYQPIARLDTAEVVAHESLIRLPAGHVLRNPDELFHAAREQGLLVQTEQACLDEGIRTWRGQGRGLLFVNLSAFAVVEMVERLGPAGIMRALEAAGVAPSSVVIEITEHDDAGDMPRLVRAVTHIRTCGVRFALDDFGEGRSNLRLWAELRPDYVKIDKYFIAGIDANPVKVQIVRGLRRFSEAVGTHLIAEGVETGAELRTVRDLGVPLGQGYGLGRPDPVPAQEVLPAAREAIAGTVSPFRRARPGLPAAPAA